MKITTVKNTIPNVETIEINRRIVGGKNSLYFPLSHHTYTYQKVRLYIR